VFRKVINSCLLASVGILFSFQNPSFKASQLKNSRVKKAYEKNWSDLQTLMKTKNIQPDNFDIYLRAFKHESLLEVWAKNKKEEQYILIKTYNICAKSGSLGPKRKQGDGQVPEGFYEISAFQPQSNFHLALKVGYPNKSDWLKTKSQDPGGDIMIHGNCVTIGCIPIQDNPIEELYVLCVEAKNRNSVIHSDIYPFRFNDENSKLIQQNSNSETGQLWVSLKKAYDYFKKSQNLPKINVDKNGNYIVDNGNL
jgi:murein L,D-transpeptidase YafK